MACQVLGEKLLLYQFSNLTNPPNIWTAIVHPNITRKLTERMIANRLLFVLEKFGAISERQAGFQRHRCPSEQIVRLSQEIKDGFQRKQKLIPKSVPGVNILLFADDMVMSATGSDISGLEDVLQWALHILYI
ncbi:hypothetical protein TNIN_46811 [Trichonephila inaurata madagascariensis]|uniref:Uncharacterized protein n=1 Tax=Trichonephila inaurata madagascariensis TaxID=2747483 RepID=A0A8X6IKY4_9ARAC|nr:hypothetical protein TNIN_46811 [Trichonephila inaurata madagascariensis]